MANRTYENIEFENVRIIFRNLSGRETQYNREGVRSFSVVIDDVDMAENMISNGWNVRAKQNRDGETYYTLQVFARFDNIPPRITLIDGKKRMDLTEETVSIIDNIDIRTVDLIIHPYYWEAAGKSGVKAYVKTMYVVAEKDRFAEKYAEEEYPEE